MLIHAALAISLVIADPAELHNDENLSMTTVACELNRGSMHYAALPDFIYGKIVYWETLYTAGLLRICGLHYGTLMLGGYLPSLLLLILWYATLRAAGFPRAAPWCALLLASGPPSYQLLALQIGGPHMNVNIFLVLALFVYFRWARSGSWGGLLLLAAVWLAGLTLTRGHWVAVVVIGGLLLARGGWPTLLRISGCLALLIPLKYAIPPFGIVPYYASPLMWEDDSIWKLLSPATIMRAPLDLMRALADNLIPATGYVEPVAVVYLAVIALAGFIVMRRLVFAARTAAPESGKQRELYRFLIGYLTLYSVLLAGLGFAAGFAENWLPAWNRFRYLVSLAPLGAVLLSILLVALPRRPALWLGVFLLAGGLYSSATGFSFQHGNLRYYPVTNYLLIGEKIAYECTPANAENYRAALNNFAPGALPVLAAGLGFGAVDLGSVDPAKPPTRLAEVAAILPEAGQANLYFSAGYWYAHFHPGSDSVVFAAGSVPVAYRDRFSSGYRLYRLAPRVRVWNLFDNRRRGAIPQLLIPRPQHWDS